MQSDGDVRDITPKPNSEPSDNETDPRDNQ